MILGWLVILHNHPSHIRILCEKGFKRSLHHGDRGVAQLNEHGVIKLDLQRIDCEAFASNTLRVITNTLQLLVDFDNCIYEPKMTRSRLLTNEKLKTQSVNFLFQLIHLLVAQNHRVRQLTICLKERFAPVAQARLGQLCHAFDLATDQVNVALQTFFKLSGIIHQSVPSLSGVVGAAAVLSHFQRAPSGNYSQKSGSPQSAQLCVNKSCRLS